MQTVCDILSAASNHLPDFEIDYYWILHLVPSSTIFEIRHQYQKLRNLLQPIENKFPGTNVALKLIHDAFSVLSENRKRSAFDLQRRTVWKNYELPAVEASYCHNASGKVAEISAKVSFECEKGSSRNLGKRIQESVLIGKHSRGNKEAGSYSTSNNSEGDVAEDILDVNCSVSSVILKDDPSSSLGTEAHKILNHDFYNFDDDRKVENMEAGQIWATHYESNNPKNRRYAQIMSKSMSTVTVMWLKPIPVSDGEKRWFEAELPVACGSFCMDLETGKRLSSPALFSYKCSWTPGLTPEQFDIYPEKGEVWAVYDDWSLDKWSYDPEATRSCKYKLVEILSEFSKYLGSNCAWLEKVQGFRSIFQRQTQKRIPLTVDVSPSMLYSLSHKVPAFRLTGEEIDGVVSGMLEVDQLALPNVKREKPDYAMISKMENPNGRPDDALMLKGKYSTSSSSSCLDENFSDIKPCLRREMLGNNQLVNVIATGQVWAIYCGRDSMPRRYVQIDDVLSRTQVRVTFLEPEPSTDLEIKWWSKNLPITCGAFRAGGTTVSLKISQLSNPVKFGKTMSSYTIYPVKGQIWAMYHTWNNEWKLSDLENCRYWIIEILSDFSEGEKIVVAKLGELKGSLTFFHRLQLDGFELVREISRTEILSFSHRISFCKVPGIGYYGISESSWHLEPSDLPPKRRKLV